MTIYAASSQMAVIVPTESFGGCGSPHSRPVRNGAPVNPWALDCPPCEDHLRHDPMWSATVTEIPETHDEKKAREDYDKRGANDVQTLLAVALANITGGEVPDTVASRIAGSKRHLSVTAGKMVCPDGHENPPGKKFCGDCGATMHKGAPAAAMQALPPSPAPAVQANGNGHSPGTWEPPKDSKGRKKPMRDWKLDDLHVLAGHLGVDPAGNRAELIDRLRAAKKEAAGITG